MLNALHTIDGYPLDMDAAVFEHYPAMKLGHRTSALYFAERLAPIARQWITREQNSDWVLTSPPLQGLPCGANLICRALFDILVRSLPSGRMPLFDALEIQGKRLPIQNEADFVRYNEYSKQNLKTRQDFHLEGAEPAQYDLANFVGRRAIFVNDINVTGTQLGSIESLLRQAGATSIDVLLVVNVERRIGQAFPQLENEINVSRLSAFEEFTAYLRDCDFQCTGKLISRLMSHTIEELAFIFRTFDAAKCEMIRDAIITEGLYGGVLFRDKMRIVERAAHRAVRA